MTMFKVSRMETFKRQKHFIIKAEKQEISAQKSFPSIYHVSRKWTFRSPKQRHSKERRTTCKYKGRKCVDRSLSHDSTRSPELRHSKDRNISPKNKSRDFVQIRIYSCDSTMSPEWRNVKDSLNAFLSDHKTKKSVDKRSHECSHCNRIF